MVLLVEDLISEISKLIKPSFLGGVWQYLEEIFSSSFSKNSRIYLMFDAGFTAELQYKWDNRFTVKLSRWWWWCWPQPQPKYNNYVDNKDNHKDNTKTITKTTTKPTAKTTTNTNFSLKGRFTKIYEFFFLFSFIFVWVLLSAHPERFSVSYMQDFYLFLILMLLSTHLKSLSALP